MKKYTLKDANLKQMLGAAAFFVVMCLGLALWFQSQNIYIPDGAKGAFLAGILMIATYLVMYQVFALKKPVLTIDEDHLVVPCQPRFLRVFLSPVYPYLTCYEKVPFQDIESITRTWTNSGGSIYTLAIRDSRKIIIRANSYSESDFGEIWKTVLAKAPPESQNSPASAGSHIRTFLMLNLYYIAICGVLAGYGPRHRPGGQRFSASFEEIAWGWGLFVIGGLIISGLISMNKKEKNPSILEK